MTFFRTSLKSKWPRNGLRSLRRDRSLPGLHRLLPSPRRGLRGQSGRARRRRGGVGGSGVDTGSSTFHRGVLNGDPQGPGSRDLFMCERRSLGLQMDRQSTKILASPSLGPWPMDGEFEQVGPLLEVSVGSSYWTAPQGKNGFVKTTAAVVVRRIGSWLLGISKI